MQIFKKYKKNKPEGGGRTPLLAHTSLISINIEEMREEGVGGGLVFKV